jgi:hypothetical protein
MKLRADELQVAEKERTEQVRVCSIFRRYLRILRIS